MSWWSELVGRAWIPICVLVLQAPAGCAGNRSTDGHASNSAGMAGNGQSGGGQGGSGMVVAGAGQGTGGGAGAEVAGSGGQGGSPEAGSGTAGGRSGAGGQAGRAGRGGTAGAMAEVGGEAGAEVTGGSGGAPEALCRKYASEFTYSTSGTFKTWSCVFDRPSLTMTCTSDAGDVTATTWAAIDDAVRENRPVGAARADVQHQTIAFTGSECRLTRDFQYDGSGRLDAVVVTVDPDAPCGTNEAAYDAWDTDGRPTHGVEHGVGGETCVGGDLAFTYDDTEHSITTVHSGGTDCLAFTTVVRYSEDGIVMNAGPDPANPTTTYDTLATAEICE